MEKINKTVALCLFVCLVDGQNSKEKALIAQSSCVGMNNQEGVVYAVPRPCKTTGLNCKQICENQSLALQDSQIWAAGINTL